MALKIIQTTMSAGEVSESAASRIDLELFNKALKLAKNVYVNWTGNVVKREGSQMIAQDDNVLRIEGFMFNGEQKYLLAFKTTGVDVYYDSSVVATVSETFTEKQIKEFKYTQSGDVFIIFHNDFMPKKLVRTAHTTWTISSLSFTNIPYYAFGNVTTSAPNSNLTYSSASGNTKITFGSSVATSGWVGQKIYLDKGGSLEIYKYTSGTVVWGKWKVEPPDSAVVPSYEWELDTGYEPVMSATRGYPSCGCFGKSRLYMAGIKDIPQCILGSNVDDYFNFDTGTGLADEGIMYVLDTFSPIQSLVFNQTLLAFTKDTEHFLNYTSSGVITPETFNMSLSSKHGSSCEPIDLDGVTIFAEKSGCVLRTFVYDDNMRNYNAENVSVLAPHLIKSVKKMATRQSYDKNPNNLAYILNKDGTITLFNLLREQNLRAFSRCETRGSYIDLCSVGDNVYCLCDRDIAGTTKRFIERFDNDYQLDCGIQKTSVDNETEWSGLGVFDGMDMDVVGDEMFYSGQYPVEDGAMTGVSGLEGVQPDVLGVGDGFKKIEVGFGFLPEITTVGLEYQSDAGISFGKTKRLVYFNAKVIDTLGINISYNGNKYKINYIQFGEDTLNNKLNLETGFKKVYAGGYGDILEVTVAQDFPTKFNLVGFEVGVE
ncbi:MAG: hypothetical protein J6S85_03865 [Methanobrevibacter sp.]|nr:hypothetical protein [Methanobrevibacter sp.]MBO7712679.1 hypothetical protein [Methanobrevibacter sp.]